MTQQRSPLVVEAPEQLFRISTRRTFLKILGAGGSIILLPSLFAARSDAHPLRGTRSNGVVLDLSTDTGILNYAYALEQLEAAFYTAVLAAPAFKTFTPDQQEVFTDLRNHEVIHREFLRAVLGGKAIESLALNPSGMSTTMAGMNSIMRTAQAFEDLGVAAYNGAGKYLKDAGTLLVAGKIVSVEARHAAAIRDMRDSLDQARGATMGTRFAGDDVVESPGNKYQGLDVKLEPSAVLKRVGATRLVATPISIGTPPRTVQGTPDFAPPSPTQ